MMTVIVIVVILIVAIIGGIIYMVSKQEKSKAKIGSAVDVQNDVLVLDSNENLALSGGIGNNLFIIDTIAKLPEPEEENTKKVIDDFQRWTGTAKGQLKRKNANLCIDIAGGSFVDGAQVIQSPCTNAITQQWAFSDNSQIQSKTKPNLCIGLNVIEKMQKLELQECKDIPNQKWAILSNEE